MLFHLAVSGYFMRVLHYTMEIPYEKKSELAKWKSVEMQSNWYVEHMVSRINIKRYLYEVEKICEPLDVGNQIFDICALQTVFTGGLSNFYFSPS